MKRSKRFCDVKRAEMSHELEIREALPADTAAIESLYPKAFPGEDLLPVVRDLSNPGVDALTLVATIDSAIVGHVIFTMCEVDGSGAKAALLAPLAVMPDNQRQGVGSKIVRAGLERLNEEGVKLVCVLGDPAYYGRLGFSAESLVEPPYPMPEEWRGAWQSQYLGSSEANCAGKLDVPAPWLDPALWAP